MTSSVDYDIAQLQTDLNRLQSDLARLENDLASEQIAIAVAESNPIISEELAEAEILAEEGRIPTPIIPQPVVYENQGWSPTPIPTTSMIDEEIAQAEFAEAQQALTTAAAALTDADVANSLANSNMENMNMVNPISQSQKIRNAIAALLAAASTLIAAEADAMWEEDNESLSSTKKKLPHDLASEWLQKITWGKKLNFHELSANLKSCAISNKNNISDEFVQKIINDRLFLIETQGPFCCSLELKERCNYFLQNLPLELVEKKENWGFFNEIFQQIHRFYFY